MEKDDGLEHPEHHIKIIIIATKMGVPLVSLKVDEQWNEHLVAPFLSAVHGFSDEKLGALDETLVKAGDLDMYVRKKHNLMLIAIMDKEMKKIEIGKQADTALELFYKFYQDEIDSMDYNNPEMSQFEKFEVLLKKQLQEYYEKIDSHSDKGFFSKFKDFFKKDKPEIR